jgi:hypothetical protein
MPPLRSGRGSLFLLNEKALIAGLTRTRQASDNLHDGADVDQTRQMHDVLVHHAETA